MASKFQLLNTKSGKWHTLTCDENNLHIENSCEIKTVSEMKYFLTESRSILSLSDHTDYSVFKRTIAGMIIEWRAHNMLYFLHISRDRTKSVDLNTDIKACSKIAYFILSLFYWGF